MHAHQPQQTAADAALLAIIDVGWPCTAVVGTHATHQPGNHGTVEGDDIDSMCNMLNKYKVQ